MNKNHRIVHLISLVALVMSLFSPILTLPVNAVDPLPDPEISVTEGVSNDGLNGDDGKDSLLKEDAGDVPHEDVPKVVTPERIQVTPAPPIIHDAVCSDGSIYAQTASAPTTKGISYSISAPDADGNYTITATLTDATTYAWSDHLGDWHVNGNEAVLHGSLNLCPPPPVEIDEPVEPVSVVPQNPTINADVCDDPTADAPHVTLAETDGVTYSVSNVDGDGYRVVLATLQDGFSWANGGAFADWTIDPANPSTATFNTPIQPCAPVSAPEKSDPPSSVAPSNVEEVVPPTIVVTNALNSSCRYNNVDDHTVSFDWSHAEGLIPQYWQVLRDGDAISGGVWTSSSDWSTGVPGDLTVRFSVGLDEGFDWPSDWPAHSITETGWGIDTNSNIAYYVVHFTSACNLIAPDLDLTLTGVCPTIPTGPTMVGNRQAIRYDVTSSPDADGNFRILANWGLGYSFPTNFPEDYPGWSVPTGSITSANYNGVGDWSECEPEFQFEISLSTDVASPGEIVEVTYTVTNVGSELGPEWPPFGFRQDVDPGILQRLETDTMVGINCSPASGEFGYQVSCVRQSSVSGQIRSGTLEFHLADSLDPSVCENGITHEVSLVTGDWLPSSDPRHTLTAHLEIECPALSISTDVSSANVKIGEEFAYTVSVSDENPDGSGGYTFANALPPGIELVEISSQPAGATCTPTTIDGITTIECDSATGPSTEGGTHEYEFTVRSSFELNNDVCGVITNNVAGTSGTWSTDSASVDTTINCDAEYVLDISYSPSNPVPGDTVEFTFTVTNLGSDWSEFDFRYEFEMPFYGSSRMGSSDGMTCRSTHFDHPPKVRLNCTPAISGNFEPGHSVSHTWNFNVSNDLSESACQDGVAQTAEFLRGAWAEDENQPPTTLLNVNCDPGVDIDKSVTIFDNENKPKPTLSAEAGDTIEYSITVTNEDNAPVEGVSFTDQFDSRLFGDGGLTWNLGGDFNADDCSFENGLLTCDDLTLGAKADFTVTLGSSPVTATNPVCGDYTNTTELTGAFEGSSEATFAIRCTLGVQHSLEQVEASYEGNPIPAGEVVGPDDYIAYELTITNSGNIDLELALVHVWDLPELDFVAFHRSDPGLDCDVETAGGYVYCQVSGIGDNPLTPNLEPGNSESAVFIVQVRPDVDPAQCTIENRGDLRQYRASGSNTTYEPHLLTDPVITELLCGPVVSIDAGLEVFSAGSDVPKRSNAEPGDTVVYTGTVRNDGPVTAEDVSFNFEMPDDLTDSRGLAWTPGGDFDAAWCSLDTSPTNIVLTCEGIELATDEEFVVTLTSSTVTATNPECGSYPMVSRLTGNYTGSGGGLLRVECNVDLEITKSASTDIDPEHGAKVVPGGVITYSITVTNTGNDHLFPVYFQDQLPEGVTLQGWQSNNIVCEEGDDNGVVIGIECEVDRWIEPNQTWAVEVTVVIPPETGAAMCGDTIGTPASITGYRTNRGNPLIPFEGVSAPAQTTIVCEPDVTIDAELEVYPAGSDEPREDPIAELGDTVVYTGTVRNDGPVPAEDVSLRFIGDYQLVDWWTPGGNFDTAGCTLSTNPADAGLILTCEGIELAPGEEFAVTLTSSPVTATNPVCGFYQMGTGLTGNYTGFARSSFTVECNVDLEITKSASTDLDPESGTEVAPGGVITYSIAVTNTGNQTLFPVYFQDQLPEGTILQGWTDPGDGCEEMQENGVVVGIECVVDRWLGPNSTHSVYVTVVIPFETGAAMCGDTIGAPASITGYKTRPENPLIPFEQNRDVVGTMIVCEPDVSITKEVNDGSGDEGAFTLGDQIEFTITVENSGSAVAEGVSFTDQLDARLLGDTGLTWTLSDDDCSFENGLFSCSDIDLAASDGEDGGPDTYSVTLTSSALTATNPVCGDDYSNTATLTGDYDGSSDPVEFAIECHTAVAISNAQVGGDHAALSGYARADDIADVGTPVQPGDLIAYEITYQNTGNIDLDYVLFRNPIPTGTEYEVHIVPDPSELRCGFPGTTGGLYLYCQHRSRLGNQPELLPGDTRSAILVVQVKEPVDGEQCTDITNVASVIAYQSQSSGDIRPGNPGEPGAISSEVTTEVGCIEAWSVEKTSDSDGETDFGVGDEIRYTITVSNEGNVNLSGLTLHDVFEGRGADGLSWPTLPDGFPDQGLVLPDIAFEDEYVIEAVYTVSQADIDAGQITNCAYVDDIPEEDGDNCVTDTIEQNPDVLFTKDPVPASVSPGIAGDPGVVGYSVFLQNRGNVTLDTATITDDALADLPATGWTIEQFVPGTGWIEVELQLTVGPLAPGESVTLRIASDPILVENIQLPDSEWCGPWQNTATLTGEYANGSPIVTINENEEEVSGRTVTTEAFVNCTSLAIEKSGPMDGNDPATLSPDDTFAYEIVVTNNGNTMAENVIVTDEIDGTLTVNSVTASLNGDDVDVCDLVNQDITCSFDALNPQDVATIVIDVSLPPVGEITWEQCVAGVENQAFISGDFRIVNPESIPVPTSITPPDADIPSDTVGNPIDCEASIQIVKSVIDTDMGDNGRWDAGDTISYEFVVTNTGDVTLYDVDVQDNLPVEFDQSTTITSLEPGAANAVTLTATYAITQTELELGRNLNCVDVFSTTQAPDSQVGETVFDDDCERTPLERVPAIEIVKDGPESVTPGEEMSYTITLTNTGNVYASLVRITDVLPQGTTGWSITDSDDLACTLISRSLNCLNMFVAPGAIVSVTVTGNAPATPGILACDTGLSNTAITWGTSSGGRVSDSADPMLTELDCEPALTIEKDGPDAPVAPGETLEFTITVTNAGTYPAFDLSITDSLIDAGVADLAWTDDSDNCEIADGVLDCDISELSAYGDAFTVTISAEIGANYPVCGEYTNTAILGGDHSVFARQTEAVASFEIDCVPAFSVDKSSDYTDADENGELSLGDEITYTIAVANDGNAPLSGLTLTDIFEGENDLTWTAPDGFDGENIPTIDVGSSITLQATYEVSQADVDAGEIENCARVTHIGDDGAHSEIDCASDVIPQHPGIALVKSAEVDTGDDDRVDAGDTIAYTFTVSNPGNITLADVQVIDPMPNLEWESDPTAAHLAPGVTITFTATWEISQEAIDEGEVSNTALVTASHGSDPDASAAIQVIGVAQVVSFAQIADSSGVSADDTIVTDLPQEPGVGLTMNGELTGRGVITYEITITNTGNITLTDLEISDPRSGIVWDDGNTIASLAPGESITLSAAYTVTQADMEVGEVRNCTEVIASQSVPATEDCVATELPVQPITPIVTPDPTAEVPATPQPGTETPAAVTKLPETGYGGLSSVTSVLWAAAMLSVVAFGASAAGIRRYIRR